MNEKIFAALGDKTRLQIVEMLAQERALCISEIAQSFDVSRQAISRHLNVLTAAGVLNDTRKSRERYFSLDPSGLASIQDWVKTYQQFWEHNLENLKALVEQEETL